MQLQRPTRFFLCGGVAEGTTPLNAFDHCLLAAGIGNGNLIKLSSILPPGVTRSEELRFELGEYLPTAYAAITSNIPGERIAAAVSIGIPQDPTKNGVIMEHSARGTKEEVSSKAETMAREALTIRGYAIKEVLVCAVEHVVDKVGGAFAAVVLWNDQDA